MSSLRSSLRITAYGSALAAGCIRGASFSHCSKESTVSRPKRGELTSVKDKVVVITGSTAGIGMACAWRFADEGSKLVLIGRREDRLKSLKAELISAYPQLQVHVVPMSVTDYKTVEALPKTLPDGFKDVEILVNNAGLARGVTSVENNSMADAIEVIETNILGTVAITTAFAPGMKERGKGHIVNMGSVAVRNQQINFIFVVVFLGTNVIFICHRDIKHILLVLSTMPRSLEC